MPDLIKAVQAPINTKIPEMHSGDNVSVHLRIIEGNKERIQEFKGTIIRLRKGGNDACFTVRRLAAHGIGVERTFLLRSPRIDRFEVVRRGKVRRAKLYYLRERQGKSARIKELRPARQSAASRAAARPARRVEPTAGERAPAAPESRVEMATVE